MKRHILVLVLLWCAWASAQDFSRIDSLQALADSRHADGKVSTLIELADAFRKVSLDESMSCAQKAYDLALESGNLTLQAEALYTMGEACISGYNLDIAKDCFSKAFDIYTGLGNAEDASFMADNAGYVALVMGMTAEAEYYLNYSYRVCDSLRMYYSAAVSLNELGALYYDMGDLDRSMDCFYRAKLYFEMDGDSLSMAECDNNMAVPLIDAGEYDQARQMLESIIPYLEKVGDKTTLANANHNIGLIYETHFNDYDSALLFADRALALRLDEADSLAICQSWNTMGNLYALKGQYDKAFALLSKALATSSSIGYVDGQIEATVRLGEVSHRKGDIAISVDFFRQARELTAQVKNDWKYRIMINRGLVLDYASASDRANLQAELDNLIDDYNLIGMQYQHLVLLQNRERYNLSDFEQRINELDSRVTQVENRRLKTVYILVSVAFIEALAFALVLLVRRRKN